MDVGEEYFSESYYLYICFILTLATLTVIPHLKIRLRNNTYFNMQLLLINEVTQHYKIHYNLWC